MTPARATHRTEQRSKGRTGDIRAAATEKEAVCAEGDAGPASDRDIPAKAHPLCESRGNRNLNHPASRKRALYTAFESKDARFDGQVFVGVSSTGIYCRPVCRARMPKYDNCTFYKTAAEAENAGYRPCLLCRPETAPGCAITDASANLARRAAALLRENCTSGESLERLAARLGYTDRHLRRSFEREFSVTPVQYLQTCRLLLAKSLLTDTDLPVAQIAGASGFKSVRRFNDAFKRRYRLTPTDLRKRGGKGQSDNAGIALRLNYRPPYRFDLLLSFFRARQLEGVESVKADSYARVVRMPLDDGGEALGWVRVTDDPRHSALSVTISESLLPVTSQVIGRIRRQFDVDCDPQAVYEGIASLDDAMPGAAVEGTRLPGCFDAFETSVRAVLGQQVTIAAANKLAGRIAKRYGTALDTGIEGLTCAFPTAAEIAALDPIEDALGQLGVIKTRSRTIAELARLICADSLRFDSSAVVSEQMERLLAVKGIGPWSANYLAMRTMGYPDAFLETDVGIKHALPDRTPAERLALAEAWRPWRSYANICLWNALDPASGKPNAGSKPAE